MEGEEERGEDRTEGDERDEIEERGGEGREVFFLDLPDPDFFAFCLPDILYVRYKNEW